MLSTFRALLLLALGSCSVNALAFIKKSPLPPPTRDSKPYSATGYSDDAFGLVFLGSLLGGQDYIFASTFVGVSAMAATATNLGYFSRNESRVPGAVAVVTLALSFVLKMVLFSTDQATDGILKETLPSATSIDVGLAVASVAWSFTNWKMAQQKESK